MSEHYETFPTVVDPEALKYALSKEIPRLTLTRASDESSSVFTVHASESGV